VRLGAVGEQAEHGHPNQDSIARVEQIVRFVLTETPYADRHWNRLVLNRIEKEGTITVTISPRKDALRSPRARLSDSQAGSCRSTSIICSG
jgi:hypothetical protein